MAKIYTKTGDQGRTSLVGGQKVSKQDQRLEAYGTIDELNSVLGFVRSELTHSLKSPTLSAQQTHGLSRLDEDLEVLQHELFDLGSLLASMPDDRAKFKLAEIPETAIKAMEDKIDAATAVLKPLKEFILPGGVEAASRLHLARTVARRAERAMVQIEASQLPERAVPFINRLSDYLFVMARYCNHLLGAPDVVWKKKN